MTDPDFQDIEHPVPDFEAPAGRVVTSAADWQVAILLFGALYLVYLFTASLTFISTDELFLFDATESIARRGDIILSETADLHWPGAARLEPVQPLLSAPFFWFANRFQSVGNAHVTLLFNALVTAFTAALLFFYVLLLDYTRQTATWVAVLFGLTTIAWPYSQNYFREPLTGLALLLAAYGFLRWRRAMQHRHVFSYRWLSFALVSAAIAILTKEAGLLALPLFVFILLPGRLWARMTRKHWLGVVSVLLIVGLAAMLGMNWYTRTLRAGIGLWEPLGRLSEVARNLGWLRVAVPGFLISPGKSIFWHSPILLLALAAPWAAKKRRVDVSWPLLLLLVFVIAYALIRNVIWFGGTNWGARYMVPITPFLMISATPLIARAVEGQQRGIRALVVMLAVLGVLVQVAAVAVDPLDYYEVLDQTGIVPWEEATWTVPHSAIVGHWRLLVQGEVNFAWAAALDSPDWPLGGLLAAGLLAGLVALWRAARRERHHETVTWRALFGTTAVLGLVVLGLTAILVRRIYPDHRYQGDNQALHQLRLEIENTTLPDPIVYLNNRTYFTFMLNYYKSDVIWYTLELNPLELIPDGAERPHPRSDPAEFVNRNAYSRVNYFGRQHETIFLVMETGPFDGNILRPMEWWLNDAFYKVQEITYADRVRLLAFSSTSAPPRSQPAANAIDKQVGDSIRIVGYDVYPDDVGILRPGSKIDISTQWEVDAPPGQDFSIGTYLITPQGTLAMQIDSYPVGGFWPTSTWRAGDVIRHNVAFVLPEDLPPGFYEVWTLMYSPFDGIRLPVSDSTGTAIRDHIVLFTLEVTR